MTLAAPRFGQMNNIIETHIKQEITVIKAGLQVADHYSLYVTIFLHCFHWVYLLQVKKSSSCVNSASVHVGDKDINVSPE